MRNYQIKLILVIFFYCTTLEAFSQEKGKDIGFPDHIILNVTEDLSTSMAFNWRTDDSQSISKIQIAKENASNNFVENSLEYLAQSEFLDFKDLKHWYHSILLKDLEENTVYVYRVGNENKWSEWMNFKTIAKDQSALKFLYFGDVQTNIKSLWSRVVQQSNRSVPDAQFVLYAGDIVNRGNNLNEWEEWFTAAQAINQSIPVMPASGNHDHADNEKGEYVLSKYWNRQFNLPHNGISSLDESSYYVNIQHAKFVVLNTELFDTDEGIRKDQLEWLEEVLKKDKKEWTILLMHHPIYSTKKNRDNTELRVLVKPLIDKYNVDLVLQGHDHTYARGKDRIPMDNNQKSNATYVVTVSGPKLTEVMGADWMDKSFSFTQLFHEVEIVKNKLFFKTYNSKGAIVDRFSIQKSNGKNKIIN